MKSVFGSGQKSSSGQSYQRVIAQASNVGSWTPVLSFGGTGVVDTGTLLGPPRGNYVRVGSLVHCSFGIGLTSKGTATSTNNAVISGLPFTATDIVVQPFQLLATIVSLAFSGVNIAIGANGGTTTAQVARADTTEQLTWADFTDNTTLIGSFHYFAS
jgi:hypothetical protein